MNGQKFENVKSVLVVLSSTAMAFDIPALRNFITLAYPGTAVFFISTSGKAVGAEAPTNVDLAIDFTPPHARQPWLFAFKLSKRAKVTVGRNAGWFMRKQKYTRVYDEFSSSEMQNKPKDYLEVESFIQKKVLGLAGIEIVRQGGVVQDRSHEIAEELPRL